MPVHLGVDPPPSFRRFHRRRSRVRTHMHGVKSVFCQINTNILLSPRWIFLLFVIFYCLLTCIFIVLNIANSNVDGPAVESPTLNPFQPFRTYPPISPH